MTTSVKVCFRPSSIAGGEGMLYFQVIRRRVVRLVGTDYRLYPSEWDARLQAVRQSAPVGTPRSARLLAVADSLRCDLMRLQRIIRTLHVRNPAYTADDVVREYRRISVECTLLNFMQNIIAHLHASGHEGTACKYQSTLNSFMNFRSGIDIPLDAVDAHLMQAYESWLRQQGLTRNGSSSYLRNLRAVYNRAVEAGLIEQQHPFRHTYTGADRTTKRAVAFDVIRSIKSVSLLHRPALALARDLFLFSFYTRGMPFVDMAYLRPDNLRNGYLTYRRQKTGQTLSVRWEPCMQEIVSRYAQPASPYLLPIIRQPGHERQQYQSCQRLVNHHLHTLSAMLGLQPPVTMYVARHSWASIAHGRGVPQAVIGGALGHENEQTTQIYLASIETSAIDEANNCVLSGL